ncbi:MAG: molybdopterin-dependent oxidoreductase, partial [Saccharothrix sp.]|nr:molybdopterin-dependent oxidoreductase [Saccharothrix sp.]
VFRWLHRLAGRVPAEVDDSGSGRRRFLITSAAVAAAAGVGAVAGRFAGGRVDVEASRRAIRLTPDVAAPPVPAGADFAEAGTPGFITPNADFYRVDTALSVPRLRARDWRLRVHGLVDRELVLTYDDLLSRPLVERTISLCCVSNEVGGPYLSTADFIGVSLRDILVEAGVRPGADQLATRSADGWTCGTPVDTVLEPDRGALLAIGMNGEPLPVEHGFPVRMVVPGLYGFVSATKWLVDAELTTFADFDAYWVKRGWARRAPIKTMSRVDRPKPFERVSAGTFVAAGVAWAQHTGVDAVEVRLDGGPWRAATLSREVDVDTWRMWRVELDLRAGSHTLEVRATDRAGRTQTAERAEPVPDGATGWHTIVFTARP